MTVLRGDLAVEQSRRLITLFKEMKDYIVDSNHLLTTEDIVNMGNQVQKNTNDIKEIKNQLVVVMDNFTDISKHKDMLIMNGQHFEAVLAYQSLYQRAKYSLVIVDDYIDIKTLDILRICSKDIKITIYSDNVSRNKITESILEAFVNETNMDIKIIPTNKLFHDRYIIIDEKEILSY